MTEQVRIKVLRACSFCRGRGVRHDGYSPAMLDEGWFVCRPCMGRGTIVHTKGDQRKGRTIGGDDGKSI